jgi:hypothetical protein
MHNYYTNYYTALKCFDTTVLSTGIIEWLSLIQERSLRSGVFKVLESGGNFGTKILYNKPKNAQLFYKLLYCS